MLGLVVPVVAELVTPLDDVLGRCHDGEREKEKGQEESFHSLVSNALRRERNMSLICCLPSTASAGHNFAHRRNGAA